MSRTHVYNTFAEHGRVALGTHQNHANFLAREALFSAHNLLALSGLHLNIPLNDILQKITYTDEFGQTHCADPVTFDLVKDRDFVIKRRSQVQFMKNLVDEHYIHFTKQQLTAMQDSLAHRLPLTSSEEVTLSSIVPITSIQATFGGRFLSSPLHQVQSIISRSLNHGQVSTFVLLKKR